MKAYNPWDFCRSINCNSMIRPEEQRKTLTCPNCKAYQMHDYLREKGSIIEEDSKLPKQIEWLKSEVNRLHVALDATIAEREKVKLRWIPVEERLPEKGNKLYLCAYKDGSIGITPYERFANGNFWTNGMRLAKGVTHWMPLPAPPKEVSK